ncbi:MAG TPA: hypothetical protein VIJ42_00870 [Stellaceae bacterium]
MKFGLMAAGAALLIGISSTSFAKQGDLRRQIEEVSGNVCTLDYNTFQVIPAGSHTPQECAEAMKKHEQQASPPKK